jgi:hypothetical protein
MSDYDRALVDGYPASPTYTVGEALPAEEFRARLVLLIEDIRNSPENVAWRKKQGDGAMMSFRVQPVGRAL